MPRKPPKPRPRVGTFRITMPNIIFTWTGVAAASGSTAQSWYNLQPGSPAINAGVAATGVTFDIDNVARPQGGTPDIGPTEE